MLSAPLTALALTDDPLGPEIEAVLAPLSIRMTLASLAILGTSGVLSHYDVVLWHFRRPCASFFVELARIRELILDLPLIVLTTGAAESLVLEAFDRGVTDYVLVDGPQLKRLPAAVARAVEGRLLSARLQRTQAELNLAHRAMAEVADGLTIVDVQDPEQPLVYCNRAFTQITGYAAEMVIGRNCRFLQGPETDPATIALVGEAISTGQPCKVRLLNYRQDGSPFWNELALAPIPGPDGRVSHYVGIQRNITAQLQLEGYLGRQNARLRTTGRLMRALTGLQLDLTVALQLVAQEVSAIIGDACALLLRAEGDGCLELAALFHPSQELASRGRAVVAANLTSLGAAAAEGLQGVRRPLVLQASALAGQPPALQALAGIYGTEGSPGEVLLAPLQVQDQLIGVMILSHDATAPLYTPDDCDLLSDLAGGVALAVANARLYKLAQRELEARESAERSLRTAEAHYRMLVENLPMAVSTIVLDTPGAQPYVSPQIEALLGFTPEEWRTRPGLWLERAHPDNLPQIAAVAQASSPPGAFQFEIRMFHRQGHLVWVHYQQQVIAADGQRLLLATIRDITRRKEAEEALRESNERYNLAVQGSSDGIWDWKIPEDSAYFSPRFRELMGYEPAGHLSGIASLAAVIHPDDLERTLAAINAHLERCEPYNVEYRLRTISGEYRWFLVRGQATWDGDGRPVRMAGSLTDIHDGKVAQQELEHLNRTLEKRITERTRLLEKTLQELQMSERHLRAVVTNAPIVLFSFDSAGIFTLSEGRGLTLLGLEPGQVVSQSVFDVYAQYPQLLADIRYVLGGQRLEAVYQLGELVFETRFIPTFSEQGTVSGVIGVSVDTTARKRVEEELARSLRFAESVTEASPDIVYVYDLVEGRNVSSNQAIHRVLGYTPQQIRQMGTALFARLMHPHDLARLPDHQRELQGLSNGEILQFEYRMRAAGGEWRWLLGREVVLQRFPDGSVHLVLGVVSDITEHKRAEQVLRERSAALAQANAALARTAHLKDEFLADMSHELRTPLNSILGRSELLREGVYGPLNDKQQQQIAAVEESGQHLLALIGDILDLSKIEAGKLVLDLEPIMVDEVCQAALRMVSQAAVQKRLRLTMELDSQVDAIEADVRRVKQILVNLLSNAVKFTPEGGEVGLRVQGDPLGESLTFTVWDNGIGIAPEDQARLFKPFEQVHSSLSREHTGTGLGLSLVLRLARLHGGSVTLESSPGAGSRFSVILPWNRSAAASGVAQEVDRPAGPLNDPLLPAPHAGDKPLLLIADDNQANIDVLLDYLPAAGYQIVAAQNGLEAVAMAEELNPALILMDIQMPVLDGLGAIRRIREAGNHATPIVALTALAMHGDRERCLAAGADIYVTKPVSMRTMLTIISDQLNRAGRGVN